ncbi:MAG: aminotransferase class IV [Lutibacter sp.]
MNLNGKLIPEDGYLLSSNNRGFKYGDSLFETIKIVNNQIQFLEDHYFRLMAGMRLLRMDIPMHFNLEFFENEILKTFSKQSFKTARARFTVFRADGGLYLPEQNSIHFMVEVQSINTSIKSNYEIEIFKDFTVNANLLSTLKTNNRLINVLASIYADENGFDNCFLINNNKNIVEAINGNVFLVFGNTIKTPPISDGCIKGIMRKKIIEFLEDSSVYKIEEIAISPFDLQKADEIFISNAIIGIQPVTKYRKKMFSTVISSDLRIKLNLI